MSKIRVYELARELNVDSKVLLTKLKSMNVDVASHQSTISAEEAQKVRSSLSGAPETSKAQTPVAAQQDAAKVVVVRRRKAEAAPPSAEPAAVETPPVEEVKPVEAAAPPPPPEAPPVVVESTPEPVIEATPEPVVVVELTPAPPIPQVAKPVVQQPVVAAAPVVTPTPPPAPTATAPLTPPPEEPRTKRVMSSGGATIVRRATQEEIDAHKAAAQAKEASLQANRVHRKEDVRGTRVTGMGLLARSKPNAGGAPGGGGGSGGGGSGGGGFQQDSGSAPPAFDPNALFESGWSGKKDKRAPTKEEEEEASRTLAKQQKLKRASVNIRTLLNQVDELTGEEEPAAVVDADEQSRTFIPSSGARRRDTKRRKDLKKTKVTTPRASYRVVKMGAAITVGELARELSIKSGDLIKKLMTQGIMATINQDLDFDTASLLAQEYNFEVESNVVKLEDILEAKNKNNGLPSETRPPIVTIMGHVDHGKTSLLDAIRQANVASGEAGGITQHIGAYTVEIDGKKIAFLDTPGHEAFSAMRARGASVTDIVILVVAADDGVMPQTVEAISHAKAAGVPIIVAINKIDKGIGNLDRLLAQLAEYGIQSEEWGGENIFVKCSALQRIGIDDLLESILLQAEVLDLKASPTAKANGSVVEAHLDKGRGPVATVMVQNGSLRTGEYIVAGTEYGRVRGMTDHLGKAVTLAGPSTPIEILGLSGVPSPGDKVNVVADERTAREVIQWRQEQERAARSTKSSAQSLQDLLNKVQTAEKLEVPIIVKADTQGSLEAVCEAVLKITSPKVASRIVHRAVGGITESDITLSMSSGAVIVGFNVRAARGLDDFADKNGVLVRYFSIIYELVDAVKAIMAGKLPPVVTEVVLGHAEVRQAISVPKAGTVAGSAVLDGKITRQSSLRLIRDSVVIYSGRIGSLRRFKDDVREVAQGYECGIAIDGYNDIRVGDVIEAYTLQESAPTL